MVRTGLVFGKWRYGMSYRKKERTTTLVVSAVLAGFRAIDTGWSS